MVDVLLAVTFGAALLIGVLLIGYGHVVVHELGHLLAARALGLPVVSVSVLGHTWGSAGVASDGLRNAVRVLPPASLPFLRVRLIAFALAGPVANLLVAWGALVLGAALGRVAALPLLLVTLVGVVMGVVNLVPASSKGGGTDGRKALRTLFRPGPAPPARPVPRRPGIIGPVPGDERLASLRAGVAGHDPATAGTPALELLALRTRGGVLDLTGSDADLLEVVALLPGLPDDQAVVLSSRLAFMRCLRLLRQTRPSPDDPEVATVVRLAARSRSLSPDDPWSRVVVGLAGVLVGLPAAAEPEPDDPGLPDADRARLLAGAALAEHARGDLVSARSLAERARALDPRAVLTRLALEAAEPVAALPADN